MCWRKEPFGDAIFGANPEVQMQEAEKAVADFPRDKANRFLLK